MGAADEYAACPEREDRHNVGATANPRVHQHLDAVADGVDDARKDVDRRGNVIELPITVSGHDHRVDTEVGCPVYVCSDRTPLSANGPVQVCLIHSTSAHDAVPSKSCETSCALAVGWRLVRTGSGTGSPPQSVIATTTPGAAHRP